MNKIVNYFKGRNFWWWLSTVLLVLIIVLILSPGLRSTITSWMIQSRLKDPELSKIEKPLPSGLQEWKLLSIDNGKVIQFSDFSDDIVFVNVWATWCAPCIAEMEYLEQLYKKTSKDIHFMFVTFEKKERVEQFLQKKPLSIPIYVANQPEGYRITTLPTTFIVKNNNIILQERGAAKWDSSEAIQFLNDLIQ